MAQREHVDSCDKSLDFLFEHDKSSQSAKPPVTPDSCRSNLSKTLLPEVNRTRKDKTQIQKLLREFAKKEVWSYADKVRIAQETGMTYHKVSKWNWDHRKKLGLDTQRRYLKT